jgi:hypothetical protein
MHNSGWKQSPGEDIVLAFHKGTVSYQERVRLKGYVQTVLHRYKNDRRVLCWDLYNEPGSRLLEDRSIALLNAVWAWAWEVRPSQPLTSGVFRSNQKRFNRIHTQNADVVTFHSYRGTAELRQRIAWLRKQAGARPLVCTEYMARTLGSRFEDYMPVFKKEKIGCFCWGLVAGKSQTIWPWESRKSLRGPFEPAPRGGFRKVPREPKVWFHDIFRKNGTPYDPNEVRLIRKIIRH